MKIPYNKQFIDSNDIKYVKKALSNEFITTGPFVKKFEDDIKNFLRCKHAYACSSGTAAIHLALLSAGVKKNDVVLIPAINFISSYNMASIIGAKIFLIDVDKNTGQITPETIKKCILNNRLKKIKVLFNMYHGGYPENINNIYKLKKIYNFVIIEDACHALGSAYKIQKKNINVGSCTHADICTFSLHPVKSITTGEGGLITTNSLKISREIKLYRSHGIKRSKKKYWKYDILKNGFNYRISDINCALGISQLKKLKYFIKKRKKIFDLYYNELNRYKNVLSIHKYSQNIKPSYHLSLININFNNLKGNKDNLIEYLISKNIFVQYHYIPIYKFKIFKNRKQIFHGANEYYKKTLSLPIFVNLNIKLQKIIIKLIKNYVKLNLKKTFYNELSKN